MSAITEANRTNMRWVNFTFNFSMIMGKAKISHGRAVAKRQAKNAEAEYYKTLNELYSDEIYNIQMLDLAEESIYTSFEADQIIQEELITTSQSKDIK